MHASSIESLKEVYHSKIDSITKVENHMRARARDHYVCISDDNDFPNIATESCHSSELEQTFAFGA